MKLTPIDIMQHEFKVTFRGLDTDEVKTFLTVIAKQMEELIKENMVQTERLEELDNQIRDYRLMEKRLEETLLTAQRLKEELLTNSRKEGELLVDEAVMEARRIRSDGMEEIRNMQTDIQELKRIRMQFMIEIRSLVSKHLDLIDILKSDDVEKIEEQKRDERQKELVSKAEKSEKMLEEKAVKFKQKMNKPLPKNTTDIPTREIAANVVKESENAHVREAKKGDTVSDNTQMEEKNIFNDESGSVSGKIKEVPKQEKTRDVKSEKQDKVQKDIPFKAIKAIENARKKSLSIEPEIDQFKEPVVQPADDLEQSDDEETLIDGILKSEEQTSEAVQLEFEEEIMIDESASRKPKGILHRPRRFGSISNFKGN